MLSKIPNSIRNYPQRFQDIYLISKEFSEHFNFDEVFDEAVKYHDPQYSLDQIRQFLRNHQFQTLSTNSSNFSHKSHAVWLLFGETGQGKSTFTNVICGSQVAVEGTGIKSKTEKIGLHISKKEKVIIIDTPGLFDTRRIKNKEISNQVVEIVQNELKHNARIDAIFLVWCPTSSMRLRFDEILLNLKKALGETAIDSVIFLVNKVSDEWSEKHENSYNELLDLLDDKGLTNPAFLVDVKQMSQEDMKELRNYTKEVKPFRDEDFEAHKIMIFFNKFLEVQKLEEEKKRQQEEFEKEVGSKVEKRAAEMEVEFQKNFQQIEEKFKGDMKKQETEYEEKNKTLQEQHRSSLRILEEKGNRLEAEMRQDKERSRRDAERRASEERIARKEALEREKEYRDKVLALAKENAQEIKRIEQRHQDELKQERESQLERLRQKQEETKSEESFWKKIPYGTLLDVAAPVVNYFLTKNNGPSTTNKTDPSATDIIFPAGKRRGPDRDRFSSPPGGSWRGPRGGEGSSGFGRVDRNQGIDRLLDRKGVRERKSFEAPT